MNKEEINLDAILHNRSISVSDGIWRGVREYARANECSNSAAVRALLRLGLKEYGRR